MPFATQNEPDAGVEFRGTERYELRGLLGAGAMGVVYRAFDREHAAHVALKCLPSTSPEGIARFKNEFRSLQDLHHENLVKLGELVHHGEQLFFTMELVDGVDLVSFCCSPDGPPSAEAVPMPLAARPNDVTLDASVPDSRSRAVNRDLPAATDERRVRSTFAQLVRGLLAIHGSSKVHCDVKPSNALVTRSGRVVLLDFGVVTDLAASQRSDEKGLTGTVPYMSPEQAARAAIGPESDWYSLGVMLFEVLTGRLPFDGPSSEILRRKQAEVAPHARELCPSIAPDLGELCDRLLAQRPEQRPSGAEILRILERAHPNQPSPPPPPLFVGRERELSALNQALAVARSGRVSVVHVEGQSGSGKTELLRKFLEPMSGPGDVLLLRGRCSEREYVPYRAVDRAIDSLAEFLKSSADSEVRAIFERHMAALVQAFPVFARVPTEGAAEAEPEPTDPHLRRLRLFRAVHALMTAISARQLVVLALDDMQWADADSLALLTAIVRSPQAPPLLLVVATRPQWQGRGLLRAWGAETIALENLAPPEALALAKQLLSRSGVEAIEQDELARRIATEASGHPLFINELVRQSANDSAPPSGSTLLDAALWARVSQLGPQSRALMKVAALAGSALPYRLLALAAGLPTFDDPISLSELAALRNEHLLQFSGSASSHEVETYHDRVAAAVRSRLSDEERRAIHRAIAEALESDHEREPEALAVHWQGAGASERAAHHALTAAARANEALAFGRAARLYQMALDCWPEQPAAAEVREQLGGAYANAGLGATAARAYLAASEAVTGVHRFDLERRAADQLFRAGHVDEAEPLIRRVLRQMGFTLPRSIFGILLFLLIGRLRLAFSGLERAQLGPGRTDEAQLAELDACWSVAVGLSMVDNIRGACLQTRHLLLALRVREPLALVRALATEAAYLAVSGERVRTKVQRILAQTETLAAELNDPYAFGFLALSKAMCCFLVGVWGQARELAQAAERVFETRPAGAMWELASARTFGLWSNFYLGDLAAMRAVVPNFIQEAETRGDRYAATLHRTGLVAMIWLASDEPAEARRQILEAEVGWSRSAFDFQRYLSTLGHCLIDLYEEAPDLAFRRIREIWPQLRRSAYLRVQNVRVEALYLRGIAAVGAAAAGSQRKYFLRDAAECARRIQNERVGWGRALASLLLAGISDLRGAPDAALRHWQAAELTAREHDMSLFAAAAAFRHASARAGQAGADDARALRSSPTLAQLREPDRMCALLAPGARVQSL